MDIALDMASDHQQRSGGAFHSRAYTQLHGPGYVLPGYDASNEPGFGPSFDETPRTSGPFIDSTGYATNGAVHTARRNSTAGVHRRSVDKIEELTDLTYVLTPVGQIVYASGAVTAMLGYTADEVVGHNVMEFIHSEDVGKYVHAFNEAITDRTKLVHHHKFRQKSGLFVVLEAVGHAVDDEIEVIVDLDGNTRPACKCFVLSARLFPSQSQNALDCYLEAKLENEAMKAELRAWDESDTQIGHEPGMSGTAFGACDDTTLITPAGTRTPISRPLVVPRSTKSTIVPPAVSQIYPYPQFSSYPPTTSSYESYQAPSTSTSTYAIARGEFPGSSGHSRPHSDMIKGASCDRTLSPQKSRSKSPARTPKLLHGEVPMGSIDSQTRKKTKKTKVDTDEHVCTDCGTTESPEWRKGLNGPKTLCNACGLRFSKKQKKVDSLHFGSLDLSIMDTAPATTAPRPRIGGSDDRRSSSSSISITPIPPLTRAISSSFPSGSTTGAEPLLSGPVRPLAPRAQYHWPHVKRELNDDSTSIVMPDSSPMV